MRRAVTLALVGGIVALVIVVIGASLLDVGGGPDAVGSGTEAAAGSDELRGADLPPPGVLPGRLWVVSTTGAIGETCQIRAVNFEQLSLEAPGELRHCTLADVSEDGRYGVAFDDDLSLVLLDLAGRPAPLRDLGHVEWDTSPRTLNVAAIAVDGSRVAWCSSPNETTVQSVESGAEQRLPGCDPRFSPTGHVVTRTVPPLPDEVFSEGELLLESADLREGLGLEPDERSSLMAYDVADDGSIATKVRHVIGLPRTAVQIWDGPRLTGQYLVTELVSPLGPSGIELSPDATRLALGWPGLLAGVFDIGFQQMEILDRGPYAWSPDGSWLAIGSVSTVAIYAPGSRAPTYVLPLTALMLRWTH